MEKTIKFNKNLPFLIHFLAEHLKAQNISLVIAAQNSMKEIKDKTAMEIDILNNSTAEQSNKYIFENSYYVESLCKDLPLSSVDFLKNKFFRYIKNIPIIRTKRGLRHSNINSKYINVTNGFRHTADNPQQYDNTVYFFGNSTTFGVGCEDKHTVSSILQQLVNDNSEKKYAVLNNSTLARSHPEAIYTILKMKFIPGDIIILHGLLDSYINQFKEYFNDNSMLINCGLNERLPNDEIFIDYRHVTFKGNKLSADKIYKHIFCEHRDRFIENYNLESYSRSSNITEADLLEAKEVLQEIEKENENAGTNFQNSQILQSYLQELKSLNLLSGTVGAIVMNCNPFTNGHRYLIEYASKQIDNLIIFVLEEDLSIFKFKERFKLVCEGTKDLNNIFVVNSGNFIISSITFPEYFEKDKKLDANFDATNDLDFFGEYIAPVLNIKIRFVGQEPTCKVTNEYNRQMKTVLPTYGIKVEEIPRKTVDGTLDGKAISASLVRKYLGSEEIEKLKPLVPPTTYDYLISNVKELQERCLARDTDPV